MRFFFSALLNIQKIKILNLKIHMIPQTKLKIFIKLKIPYGQDTNAKESTQQGGVLSEIQNQNPEFMLDRMVFSSLQEEKSSNLWTLQKDKKRKKLPNQQYDYKNSIDNSTINLISSNFDGGKNMKSKKWFQYAKDNMFSLITEENFLGFSSKDLQNYQVIFVEDQGRKQIKQLTNNGLEEQKGMSFIPLEELNVKLFEQFCSPEKVTDGGFHNTYFLAALRALAEKPQRILRLFSQNGESVRLVWKGKWRQVGIQNIIPIQTERKSVAFQGQELVSLLEQAWAIIFDGYANTRFGFCEQVLHAFTGAPITQVYLRSEQNLEKYWEYLKFGTKNEYVMVGLLTNQPWLMKYPMSLSSYAYTILNAFQLIVNGEREKIIQLRTIAGGKLKKGRWSYDSLTWEDVNEELKSTLCSENNQKRGIFYLSYEEIVETCKSILVAQVSDNASFVYQSLKKDQSNGALFNVRIYKNDKYNFRIDKTREPLKSVKDMRTYRPDEASFEVVRRVDRQLIYYEGMISRKKLMSKTYYLEEGVYLVYAKDKNPEDEITFGIYSDYSPKITPPLQSDESLFFSGQCKEQNERSRQKKSKQGDRMPDKSSIAELSEEDALSSNCNDCQNQKQEESELQIRQKIEK